MNNETPVPNLTPEQIEAAAKEAQATNKMLLDWSEKQGQGILKQMEMKGHVSTLSMHWPKIKKGWIGGFVSGVNAGFQLGYKAANKLSVGFLSKSSAVAAGTERKAIEESNAKLKAMLETAIQEAADIGINLDLGHVPEERKLVDIVNRLYAEFATPVPETPQAAAEAAGQERLPL